MSSTRPTAPGHGGLVPRHGMYAGPNYAGGQTWAPKQLPTEQAWQVRPIGFLDDVTRTHDIHYTYIEQTHQGTDPAAQAARTQALWQADKEMLFNMLHYRPQNWLESQYRTAAIEAFVAKADLSYRKHVDVVGEWNRDLAGIDPRFPAMPETEDGRARWSAPGLVHAGATYTSTGMQALSTSGVNLQAALLFNTHIRPGRIDPLAGTDHLGQAHDPLAAQDFSRRILVPQRDPIHKEIFTAEGYVDGKRVAIHYNTDEHRLVRTTYNGEQPESVVTYTGQPDTGQAGRLYGHANFTVTRQRYANGEPVGEPEPLPPVLADKLPELQESSHTTAIAEIVTQGERAVYPSAPTEADKAWHNGKSSLFPAGSEADHPQPLRQPTGAPSAAPDTAPTLSPTSQTLLHDARHEVQSVAQQHGLAWDQGLENTVWSLAAAARQHGMSRIEMTHVQAGQIRIGQMDHGQLRVTEVDAHRAANTAPESSSQALLQFDEAQRKAHEAQAGIEHADPGRTRSAHALA